MEVYGPRELANDGKKTGLWHYCYANSEGTRPIGYCAQDCPGHATPEEAELHQRQYVLDHEVRHYEDCDAQKRCLVCEQWTQHRVDVGRVFTTRLVLCQGCATPGQIEVRIMLGRD